MPRVTWHRLPPNRVVVEYSPELENAELELEAPGEDTDMLGSSYSLRSCLTDSGQEESQIVFYSGSY